MGVTGRMAAALATTLISACASANVAACSRDSAAELVRSFYGPNGHDRGVPSLDALATTKRPYTRRLHWLLIGAAKYRDDFTRKYARGVSGHGVATANPKPPFVDGDPFGEWMDGGPPDLRRLELREDPKDRWEVRVQSTSGAGSPWRITVRIAPEDGACAIDDVVYEDGSLLSTFLAWRGDPTL